MHGRMSSSVSQSVGTQTFSEESSGQGAAKLAQM